MACLDAVRRPNVLRPLVVPPRLRGAEPAGGAPLEAFVVAILPASAAPDVRGRLVVFAHRGRAFTHQSHLFIR